MATDIKTSRLAPVNGIQLAYQTLGQGDPLILLHGGGQRDASWDRSGMTHHRLAILPGVTHYDINVTPALAQAVIPFLDGA